MLRVLPIHIPRFTGPRQTCFAFSGVNSMDHVTHNFIQSELFRAVLPPPLPPLFAPATQARSQYSRKLQRLDLL